VTALLLALVVAVQGGVQLPQPPRGYGTSAAEVVVDAAGVLPPDAVDRINRVAFDVKQKSGGEMAVVTLPDIGGRDVSDIALQIGRAWGVGGNADVGDRTRNAGVVILVVPKERAQDGRGRCWVSTGRGTEGFILDADAGQMCRDAIPLFQRQDYGGAMTFLAMTVANEFAREFGFALDTSLVPQVIARPRGTRSRGIPPQLFFLIFILLLFMLSNAGRRRRGCGPVVVLPTGGFGGHHRHSGWGGGGWGGGGGGFGGFGGGGGFSGGGGGSSW
jgi:uncharacterized protein